MSIVIDDRDDQDQDRADVGIVEFADRLHQVLADAAGADEAEHRRAAHVDLEAQQREAGEAGEHLRQCGEADGLRSTTRRTARRPSTGFMSMFSVVSKNCLPSAPAVWMRERQHARQRAEAEGDDEDEREHDVRHGAAEFEQRGASRTRAGALPVRLGEATKLSAKRGDRAGQRADIGHQDRLADQSQRALEAPEPCGGIGPHPRAGVERHQAVEVAEEAADLGEERLADRPRPGWPKADQSDEDRAATSDIAARLARAALR